MEETQSESKPEKAKRKKSVAQRSAEKQAERERCTRRIAELEKAIGTRRDMTREADRRVEEFKRDKKKAKGRAEKDVFQRSIENEKNALRGMTKQDGKDRAEIAKCANKIARLSK